MSSRATATTSAPNSMAWAASRPGLPPPAASPASRNFPGLRRMMSAAWVPIDPVEPSRTMSRAGPPGPGWAASMPPLSSSSRPAGAPERPAGEAGAPGRPAAAVRRRARAAGTACAAGGARPAAEGAGPRTPAGAYREQRHDSGSLSPGGRRMTAITTSAPGLEGWRSRPPRSSRAGPTRLRWTRSSAELAGLPPLVFAGRMRPAPGAAGRGGPRRGVRAAGRRLR